MKFTRSSSSKDVEAATDSNASPVNAKGSSRRFASPKKNKADGGFDLLASVNGEDDARNDKSSYAQRIFRRPAKTSDAKEPTSPTNSSSLSSLFQFKSSEDNARDAAPSTGSRRKTKEKDGTKSSKSAHPALFQFKSRENYKLKDQSAAKAGTSASPPAQSSSLPSMFQLNSNEKEEATKPVHRRRTKKSEAATTKDTTAVASATPSLFQFRSTEDEAPRPAPVTPILRRRPSKDKDEKEKAPVAASALFPFSSSSTDNGEKASARDAASTSAGKRSTKAVAAATAATAAVGVAALPAMFQFNSSGGAAEAPPTTSSSSRTLFGRKSFDKDEDQATAAAAAAAARSAGGGEEVKEGRNPVLMAKLFPKQERKQTKVCYHNFSADAANVVQVEQDETAPKVLYPNHVLIKVQVRLQLCGA
jgi:hypothetical protein